MKMLLDYWKGKLTDINEEGDAKPSMDEVLEQTKELFDLAHKKNYNLSRVHLHPYGSFLMCYDTSKWQDAKDAIIKSSITLPKYCVRQPDGTTPADWTNLAHNFQVPELPR